MGAAAWATLPALDAKRAGDFTRYDEHAVSQINRSTGAELMRGTRQAPGKLSRSMR